MAFPVAPVIRPGLLAGTKNGEIPGKYLADVGPGGKLLIPVAKAWLAMVHAAAAVGIALTYTYGGTFRDFAGQLQLFTSRYRPVSYVEYVTRKSSHRRYWAEAVEHGYSSRYWVKKEIAPGVYPASAAAPGHSNHGWAIAIDAAEGGHPSGAVSLSKRALSWLLENAADFGFSWEIQSEPWHIRYVVGDIEPQAVANFQQEDTMHIIPDAYARLVDTRKGVGLGGRLTSYTPVKVPRHPDAPAKAVALTVTVTVVGAEAPGYVAAWTEGAAPTKSCVNFPGPIAAFELDEHGDPQVGKFTPAVANTTVVTTAADGTWMVMASKAADLVVDVAGWTEIA